MQPSECFQLFLIFFDVYTIILLFDLLAQNATTTASRSTQHSLGNRHLLDRIRYPTQGSLSLAITCPQHDVSSHCFLVNQETMLSHFSLVRFVQYYLIDVTTLLSMTTFAIFWLIRRFVNRNPLHQRMAEMGHHNRIHLLSGRTVTKDKML